MKQIKFREWDGLRFFHVEIDSDDKIFQLSTGLKDKNGKEIYEGDICKVISIDHYNKYIVGKVEWGIYTDDEYVENLENWMLLQFNGNPIAPLSCIVQAHGVRFSRGTQTRPNTIEIIGNIFENSNLIQKLEQPVGHN